MSDDSIRPVIDHLVDGVPGVRGVLVASVDGFVITSRLPADGEYDTSAIAAMSAATLGLANRLVKLGGEAPAETGVARSGDTQIWVFAVGASAALTVIADSSADAARIDRVGREISAGLATALAR